jgi:RNase P subunit RPR2
LLLVQEVPEQVQAQEVLVQEKISEMTMVMKKAQIQWPEETPSHFCSRTLTLL